jgi:hypothetical protein
LLLQVGNDIISNESDTLCVSLQTTKPGLHSIFHDTNSLSGSKEPDREFEECRSLRVSSKVDDKTRP